MGEEQIARAAGARQRPLVQVHYVPVHAHPDYHRFVTGQTFPGADSYYASCLSLPMYPALTDADVERVIEAVGTIVSG